MKYLILTLLLCNTAYSVEDNFVKEAKELSSDLKMSLMKNLSEKINQEGVVEAVPFCHANVKSIAKKAAQTKVERYEFGRTSHKVRNKENSPQPWAEEYLKEFAGSKKGDIKKDYIVHKLDSGKRIFMEPLYVEAKCLLCHGENVSSNVKDKIQQLYPQDKATGFKLGEFRGFIWVKEK